MSWSNDFTQDVGTEVDIKKFPTNEGNLALMPIQLFMGYLEY